MSTASPAPKPQGSLAVGGALVAAILSSACCWLPLLLVGAGASVASASAFFESWRWPLVGMSVILLAVGFFLAYRRPRCEPGQACELPRPGVGRFSRAMLWVATVFVVAFAAFPGYVGAFLESSSNGTTLEGAAHVRTYRIEGMTCEACAVTLREALLRSPAVAAAEVSYEKATARIAFEAAPSKDDDEAVAAAARTVGYGAEPVS